MKQTPPQHQQMQPPAAVVSTDSTINLGEIASRWKFRPSSGGVNGGHSAAPHSGAAASVWGSSGTAAPPDLRAEFLKLRADLLRREPLMGQVSSIESELATTIDSLRRVEIECKELRLQVQDTQSALSEAQRQVEKQADQISRLQRELFDTRTQLDDERAALQRLRSSTTHLPPSPGMLSPQGSLLGSPVVAAAVRSTPVAAAASITPPTAARFQRAASPGVNSSRQSAAARSPARAR
jgi:septal ring factor EnvC (AmiA/AmiB activator)